MGGGRCGVEKLFGCILGLERRGRAESGEWGAEQNKEGERRRDAPAGEESLDVRSPLRGSLGSAICCLQFPILPPGAAETLSLLPALGSNPLVGRDWKGEVPGMTF